LQLIRIGVDADHSANFTKNLFKAISSQKNNLKVTVILLSLINRKEYILNHGHHVKEELDCNKVALVMEIWGQCNMSSGTEVNQLPV
jgi:hypothetical protein